MSDYTLAPLPPLGTSGYILVGEHEDVICQHFYCISTGVKILIDSVLEPWISIRFLPDGVYIFREESEEDSFDE